MGERTHPPDRTPRPGARGRRLLLAGGLILALVLGYLARSAGPAENTPGRGLAPSVTPAPARLLPPSAARTSASRARSPTQLPAPLRPAADPTALTPTSPPTIPAALAGPPPTVPLPELIDAAPVIVEIASARAPPPPTAPIGQFVPDPRLRENITVQQWLKKPPYLEGAVLGLLETPAQYQRLHAGPGDFLLFLRPATSEHIACDEAAVAGFYEDRGRGLGGGTCGAAGRPGATRL